MIQIIGGIIIIKNKEIQTSYGKRILKICHYSNNDRLALLLYDSQGYSDDITINLPDMPIASIDEGFINGDINNVNIKGKNLVNILKDLGIIKESYGFISYNLGCYEYVKFDMNKLKEYDSKGFKDFMDKNNIDEDININI